MLLFMDGADHYGSDATLLTQGVYASATGVTLSNANPRTGERHFRITPNNGDRGLRKVLGADKQEVGVGYAFYIPTLPTDSSTMVLAAFANNAYEVQATIALSSTGQVLLYRGKPGDLPPVLLGSSAPVVVARSYQHFEAFFTCSDTIGACEVRMNGVTVLSLTGLDTKAQATDVVAQVKIGLLDNNWLNAPGTIDIDDLFFWDTEGTSNTDFIGDKKVYTCFPDSDKATQDWAYSTGSQGWPLLDNVPPLDGSEYLVADNPGLVSSFGISNLPTEVVAIAGVMLATRAQKTDAGNAKIQLSMDSVAAQDVGVEHALSQAWTYYFDVFEVDPNTDAPWAVAAFNLAGLTLERTE